MMFKFFGVYVYITRHRMKRRGKLDDLRRNKRTLTNRIKKRLFTAQSHRCGLCLKEYPQQCLHIHHLKPVCDHPHLIARKSNTILLCDSCHNNIHNQSNGIFKQSIKQ